MQEIYRTGIVSPVGSPLVDLDPIHNRPPTAQTFDVVDAANPAFGQRFTVIANHFKSKGCPGTGADADAGDGQSCFADRRTQQATRLLTWINSAVLPAAGDPDILLLGDFNSYAKEDPKLGGVPFFFWYQFLWVFLCAGLTYTAHRLVLAARSAGPGTTGRAGRIGQDAPLPADGSGHAPGRHAGAAEDER